MKTQQNIRAERFLEKLIAACSRYPVSLETKATYLEKLSKWNLTKERWDEALDAIIAECTDGFPLLGQIYPYLKGPSKSESPIQHWTTFDYAGVHYAQRCQDAMNPPLPPDEATNLELHPDPRLITGYRPASPSEAREAFRRGWLESGADPAKVEEYFKIMTAKTKKRELKPTGTDDIPF